MTGNAFLPYEQPGPNLFTKPVTISNDDGAVSLTVNGSTISNNTLDTTGNALTAAGTTQATGLAITNTNNNITTAAASTGVTLPVGLVGNVITIFNNGANPIKVYGNATDSATIDGVAGATGVTLTNALRCQFFCVAAATWLSSKLGATST